MRGVPLLPVLVLLTGCFDLLVAAGIYLYLEKLRRRCAEIRHQWRPVQATILSSELARVPGNTSTLYTSEIRYAYSVDGQRYECDRISAYPKWSSNTQEPHLKLVERFPAGREFTAWVNPRKLQEAVLIADPAPPKGLRIVLLILAAAGGATLIGGVGAWVLTAGPRA